MPLEETQRESLRHTIKVHERDGVAPAGDFLHAGLRPGLSPPNGAVDAHLVKEVAYLLFRIGKGNGSTKDALGLNNLVTGLPEILEVTRSEKKPTETQGGFDFEEDE